MANTSASQLKARVDTKLNSLSINTLAEVDTFTSLGRDKGNMATVLADLQSNLGTYEPSRRRVRHDTRELLAEGSL